MSAALDRLAISVAAASLELRRATANRSQAKKARKMEFARYAEECGEDSAWYPITNHYGSAITDAGCENAIATFKGAQSVVTAARGQWRRATTKYQRAIAKATA